MVVALLALHWLRVSLISANQHKQNWSFYLICVCVYLCVWSFSFLWQCGGEQTEKERAAKKVIEEECKSLGPMRWGYSTLPSWPLYEFSLPYLLLLSPLVPFSPHLLPLFLTCSLSSSIVPSLPPVPSLPCVFPLPHLLPLSATCSLCFSPVPSLLHLFPLFRKCSLSSPTAPSPPHLFPLSLFTLFLNSLTILSLTHWFLSVLRKSSLVWCSCSWSCCGWPDLLDLCPAGLPSFLSEPPTLFPSPDSYESENSSWQRLWCVFEQLLGLHHGRHCGSSAWAPVLHCSCLWTTKEIRYHHRSNNVQHQFWFENFSCLKMSGHNFCSCKQFNRWKLNWSENDVKLNMKLFSIFKTFLCFCLVWFGFKVTDGKNENFRRSDLTDNFHLH